MNRCDKVLVGCEIIELGQVIFHTDGARRGAFDAFTTCSTPHGAMCKNDISGVMAVACEENFMDMRNECNQVSGTFVDTGAASGAFMAVDYGNLVIVNGKRAKRTDAHA